MSFDNIRRSTSTLIIIGRFAREHGALVPDRLVTSAKSWLSNAHIDPRRRSLPWGSEIEEDKLSPFECSRRYLAHLKNAFLYAGRVLGRSRDLSQTEMVLTVPASFDAVARNLTAEAAEAAGLGKVILLEEPQAAFYAWIAQADREWRSLDDKLTRPQFDSDPKPAAPHKKHLFHVIVTVPRECPLHFDQLDLLAVQLSHDLILGCHCSEKRANFSAC